MILKAEVDRSLAPRPTEAFAQRELRRLMAHNGPSVTCRSATTDTARRNIPLAVVRTPRSIVVARMATLRTERTLPGAAATGGSGPKVLLHTIAGSAQLASGATRRRSRCRPNADIAHSSVVRWICLARGAPHREGRNPDRPAPGHALTIRVATQETAHDAAPGTMEI